MTPQAIADTYAGEYCTLDGRPAIIAGRLEIFATVLELPCGKRVEFSWSTVHNVMEHDRGRFYSDHPEPEHREQSAAELHRKAEAVPLDYYAGTDWMTHGRS